MSLRGKRPLESRSRGNSPPDKRSRPPEPRPALQDRSPSSIGSGASTPTRQAALPVPSMLPFAVSRQHQDEATGPIALQALRRLKARKKEIASHARAAVARQEESPAPATSTSKSHEVQLKVHQFDIAQLKKEREELTNRLKKIEASVQQLDRQGDDSTEVQTLKNRVNSIEAFSLGTELPSLRTGIEELKPSLNSIANLSNLEQQVLQLRPVLDKIDNLNKDSLVSRLSSLEKQTEQLKPLSERVDQLANASLPGSNKDQHAMKQTIASLKNDSHAQTTQITKLENLISALSKSVTEQNIKDLVLQEVVTKTDDAKRIIRNEYKTDEEELKKTIKSTQLSLAEIQTQVGTFGSFKETMEKQNITAQLKDLQNRILNADSNNDKTFAKIEKLNDRYDRFKKRTDDDIEHLDKYCKNLREKLHEDLYADLKRDLQDKLIDELYDELYDNVLKKISDKDIDFRKTTEDAIKKLTRNVDRLLNDTTSIFDSVNKLTGRVDELENKEDAVEKITRKPKFTKVGTRMVPSSPSSNDNSVGENSPNQRITQLEADVNDFRQALDKVKDFTADAAAINGRLEKVEATSEGLSKLEQQVAEHESLRSSLTALDARFTDSIQPLQRAQSTRSAIVQPHSSGPSLVPEETANNVTPDTTNQLNASLNGLIDEMERIDGELNNALMAIDAQGTRVRLMESTVPDLFRKQFDPFKTKVEGQIGTLDDKLEQCHQDMVSMRQEMQALQVHPQQTTFGYAQQAQLDSMVTETSALKSNLSDLQLALGTKVDNTTHNTHMKALNFAFSNLEARYDNITTDELYKRIVRWFVQTYPDTSDLLNTSRRISQMLQDIDQLKHSHAQVAWVQSCANDIQGLCRNATQLQQLVKDMPQLQLIASRSSQLQELVESPRQSAEMLTKIEEAYTNAQDAFYKVEQCLERIDEQDKKSADFESRISGLQSSIRVLTSNTESLVKPTALNDLTTTLQERLDQVKGELTAGMQKLCKSSDDKIQDLRVSSQELRKRSDVVMADFQSKLDGFEGTRSMSDSRIQELEKFQSKLNDKIDAAQKDSDEKIKGLSTRLYNEAKEMHANVDTIKDELLNKIKSDKKESVTNIDDTKTELLEKINVDLVAKMDNEKKDSIIRCDDIRTKLLATLDDRVKELLTTINANQEESLTTAERNKNDLVAKIDRNEEHLLDKMVTEKREVGARMQMDQSKREKAEDGLRKLINDAKDDANQNVTDVRESLATLRTKFDAINTLVEPNTTFIGSLGNLYVVVVQLQQLFESLNQNTGVAPLEFNWAFYLANILSEPKPNGASSRKPSLT